MTARWAMILAAGAQIYKPEKVASGKTVKPPEPGELGDPGLAIHEMGTACMGKDPRTSVLNKYNQVHDVPNVFVTDGAAMASGGASTKSARAPSLMPIFFATVPATRVTSTSGRA